MYSAHHVRLELVVVNVMGGASFKVEHYNVWEVFWA